MNFFNQLEALTKEAKYFIEDTMSNRKNVTICNYMDLLEADFVADLPEFPVAGADGPQEMVVFTSMRVDKNGEVEFVGVLKGKNFPREVILDLQDLNSEDVIYVADYLGRCLAKPVMLEDVIP